MNPIFQGKYWSRKYVIGIVNILSYKEMIYKIIYTSQSVETDNKAETLANILKISRKNNELNNITGLLLYFNGDILQILEGNKENVLETYSKIESDIRHKNIQLLMKGNAESRSFPEWFMGYKVINDEIYSNYLERNNILNKVCFKDFFFNHEKPLDTIIDIIRNKYI